VSDNLLFAGLVDKVSARFFDRCAPAADLFSSKVLVGKIIVIGVDLKHSTFENRTVFFKSLDARE
jgi:hypothetical protein